MGVEHYGIDGSGSQPEILKIQQDQEDVSKELALSGLLSLATGVVFVGTLYIAREILVPLALAILLSFVLAPLVRLLRHVRLGRIPAVCTAAILALFVILSLGVVIVTQVTELVSDIPRYATTIESKVSGLRSLMVGQVSGSVGRFSERIRRASNHPAPPVADPVGPNTTAPEPPPIAAAKPMPVEVHQPAATPLEILERLFTPIVVPLSTIMIVFIVAIFILLQQGDLRERFIRLFGLHDVHRTATALDDAANRLSRYLLTLVVLNTAFGVFIGIGLVIIGVPNPLLWATLAGLLRFVPYIGAVISGALPTTLAAAIDPHWGMALWTVGLFLVSETVMGQFVDPIVNGRSTGLSPVSVVIATIFWSWMWGPIGLILATPLTVCLVVLGRYAKRLQFLEVLMGDQPALTQVDGFYQRILANDRDETLDYAEACLKDQPLSVFYDDVAIMGLRSAMHDAERGVLTSLQLVRIQREMARLLPELADKGDVLVPLAVPNPSRMMGTTLLGAITPTGKYTPDPFGATRKDPMVSRHAVLCISGRGVLDEPVAAMLAQMLDKNGMPSTSVPFEAASRENIGVLNLQDVPLICIIYLELTDSPSHLRYLVRRFRQLVPDVPILVGLWPAEELAVRLDARLRAAIGADHYTTSLRDAVIISQAIIHVVGETNISEVPAPHV